MIVPRIRYSVKCDVEGCRSYAIGEYSSERHAVSQSVKNGWTIYPVGGVDIFFSCPTCKSEDKLPVCVSGFEDDNG